MKLFYRNALDDAILTGSSERSGFPWTNVLHPHLTVHVRTNNPSSQSVLFDAGVGKLLDASMCALAAHNLTADADVTFKMNDVDSWTSPPVSEVLDPSQELILKEFAPASRRYARLDLHDPDNPEGYIRIGRAWAGPTLKVLPAMLVNFRVIPRNNDRRTHSDDRQLFCDVGTNWRAFELSFPPTAHEMARQIHDVYREVGHGIPFIFSNVDSRAWALIDPCYVSIESFDGFEHHGSQRYRYSLVLEEEH